ncbi:hypothetical protein JR316_0012244 [Psilocybe cubensis]|uniref:Uncharacterized protein n=1 Tax=Psilocybe cubensis TaxID=181762 RepID=A0ACB8GHP0_PSICU|nr:hypothetical protein JR316_0012244 [Psilocybe cubensis]KAH9475133.1 hypothetical protein JR316_0012244 [Psilocybe cubensis]
MVERARLLTGISVGFLLTICFAVASLQPFQHSNWLVHHVSYGALELNCEHIGNGFLDIISASAPRRFLRRDNDKSSGADNGEGGNDDNNGKDSDNGKSNGNGKGEGPDGKDGDQGHPPDAATPDNQTGPASASPKSPGISSPSSGPASNSAPPGNSSAPPDTTTGSPDTTTGPHSDPNPAKSKPGGKPNEKIFTSTSSSLAASSTSSTSTTSSETTVGTTSSITTATTALSAFTVSSDSPSPSPPPPPPPPPPPTSNSPDFSAVQAPETSAAQTSEAPAIQTPETSAVQTSVDPAVQTQETSTITFSSSSESTLLPSPAGKKIDEAAPAATNTGYASSAQNPNSIYSDTARTVAVSSAPYQPTSQQNSGTLISGPTESSSAIPGVDVPQGKNNHSKTIAIALGAVFGVLFLFAIGLYLFIWHRRSQSKKRRVQRDMEDFDHPQTMAEPVSNPFEGFNHQQTFAAPVSNPFEDFDREATFAAPAVSNPFDGGEKMISLNSGASPYDQPTSVPRVTTNLYVPSTIDEENTPLSQSFDDFYQVDHPTPPMRVKESAAENLIRGPPDQIHHRYGIDDSKAIRIIDGKHHSDSEDDEDKLSWNGRYPMAI